MCKLSSQTWKRAESRRSKFDSEQLVAQQAELELAEEALSREREQRATIEKTKHPVQR